MDSRMEEHGTSMETASPTPSSWRRSDMDLKGHLRHVLENELMEPNTFLLEEDDGGVGVSAHRFMLKLWSEDEYGVIDKQIIPGVTRKGFQSLLKYLYTEEFDVSVEDLLSVLCLSDILGVPAMAAKCTEALKAEIGEGTAVEIYEYSKQIGGEALALAEQALDYISKNGYEVLEGDRLINRSHEVLCDILERDNLEMEELNVFQAVLRWATNECQTKDLEPTPENLCEVLGRALTLIRFPLMNSRDIALHVAPTGILTDKQLVSVLLVSSLPKAERVNLPQPEHGFIDRERKPGTHSTSLKEQGKDSSRAQSYANLQSNLLRIWENRSDSDVSFVVGPEKELVYAHKFILSLWSAVFERQFQQKWDDASVEVEISSPDVSGFRSFLKVLYTQDFKMPVEEAIKVLWFAKEYDVKFMAENCMSVLKRSVGDNTVVSIYQAAKLWNEDLLANSSWNYIIRRAFGVVKNVDFMNIEHHNLCLLLEQDDLNVGELQLFQSVLKWAMNQCEKRGTAPTSENLRGVLGNAVMLIRFPVMSVRDFLFQVVPARLLTVEQVASVLVIHNTCLSSSDWGKAKTTRVAFNCKERSGRFLVKREETSLCNLSFMSDKAIVVHGFSFSGVDSSKVVSYAPSSLVVLNYPEEGKCYSTVSTETSVVKDGDMGFTVKFRTPIPISPNQWYISSQTTNRREDAELVEKETWASIKSRQADINFQFQIQPLPEVHRDLEYAVPEVLFSILADK